MPIDSAQVLVEAMLSACDGVLARVWLEGPGDLCESCPMRPECPDQTRCLHLERSAGLTERVDGPFRRFPIGVREVGRVFQTLDPFVATSDLGALGLADPTWLMVHEVRSFAAVPLPSGERCIGVAAVFARALLDDARVRTLKALGALAGASLGTLAGASLGAPAPRQAAPGRGGATIAVIRPLAETEREIIERVLVHAGGRVSGPRGAAKLLGLKPTTLHSRMKKLGVRRSQDT